MNFDALLLRDEQKEILQLLVSAATSVRPEDRMHFHVFQALGPDARPFVTHEGLPQEGVHAALEDLEALRDERLVTLTPYRPNSWSLGITPKGYAYCAFLRSQVVEAGVQMEEEVVRYLTLTEVRSSHAEAFQRWAQADAYLHGADSMTRLTEIGHLCREALQLFTADLVRTIPLPAAPADPAKTVARLREALRALGVRSGSATEGFLDALVAFWGATADLIQRQEHGAMKEGETLTVEDGRRVVYYTGLVLFEVRRTLDRFRN